MAAEKLQLHDGRGFPNTSGILKAPSILCKFWQLVKVKNVKDFFVFCLNRLVKINI